MAGFGRRSTAEQVSAGIDLTGITALVTGANTGLGLETTRVLALRGARVHMACRDQLRATEARDALLAGADGIAPEQLAILALDLNDLGKVREAGKEFLALGEPLDLLVNNAGIMIPMERRTADGFEAHLGINHLGHYLFTRLVLDSLLAAERSRVVVLSSAAAGLATLTDEFDDLNWERRRFRGFPSYGDSKLMNHMFARELYRRYGDQGLVANALHPGVIATELGRDQSAIFNLVGVLAYPFMKTIPQGAATTLRVATDPRYATRGGLFFKDCREARPPHRLALNDGACEDLWQISAELVGLH